MIWGAGVLLFQHCFQYDDVYPCFVTMDTQEEPGWRTISSDRYFNQLIKCPPPSESPRHWTVAETYFLFKSDLFVCQTILLHAVTYMDLDSICKPHLNTVLISFLLRREDCLSHEPCLGHSWQVTLVWVCSVCVLGLGGLTFKCNQHWDSLIATGQSATTSTDYD